jgi:hypothetical protein
VKTIGQDRTYTTYELLPLQTDYVEHGKEHESMNDELSEQLCSLLLRRDESEDKKENEISFNTSACESLIIGEHGKFICVKTHHLYFSTSN